jgi:hypothetical protein
MRKRNAAMPKETYEISKDDAQTLNIEQLVQHSSGLVVKLNVAETEIGRLRLAIEKAEGGELALVLKLEDANSEIGRLRLALGHDGASPKGAK